MKCPKCSGPMSPVTHQSIEVDRCATCGGLWFDMLEADDLKKLSGSHAIDTGDKKTGKVQNKIGRIRCPKDSATMLRMVVNDQPHIWYESCPVCYGTYFDAGEFRDFKAETFMDTVRGVLGRERK